MCKQCSVAGRVCKGFYYEKHSFDPVAPAILGGLDAIAVAEPAPPDWTYMEGCRYCTFAMWQTHRWWTVKSDLN